MKQHASKMAKKRSCRKHLVSFLKHIITCFHQKKRRNTQSQPRLYNIQVMKSDFCRSIKKSVKMLSIDHICGWAQEKTFAISLEASVRTSSQHVLMSALDNRFRVCGWCAHICGRADKKAKLTPWSFAAKLISKLQDPEDGKLLSLYFHTANIYYW